MRGLFRLNWTQFVVKVRGRTKSVGVRDEDAEGERVGRRQAIGCDRPVEENEKKKTKEKYFTFKCKVQMFLTSVHQVKSSFVSLS